MELRPGYKQTEVGLIPEEWAVIPFSDLLEFRNGVNADKQAYGKGIPFINVLEVITKTHLEAEDIPGKVLLSNGIYDSYGVRCGDLLFNRTSETQEEVGLSSVYLGIAKVVFGGFVIRGRPIFKALDPVYSGYAFRITSVRAQIISRGQGAIRANIGQFDLKQVFVPIPLLPEQRAIAAALSDVDALIGALDRLIAKKRDLKQAAMQQLLTGQTRLPGFSGAWEVKRLGEVATFHKGKGLAKSELDPFGSEPCIHYGELFTRHPETISEILSRTNTTTRVFRSAANDVLMPTSDVTPNGLARASCVQQSGIVLGGDILVIRTNAQDLFGSFLSYVIRQLRDQVMQLVTGTTVFHLYGADMKKFEFSMPMLGEQQAIVQILDDMDAEITALEARRDKTRALKQGMMQELLTGRIRLV